MATHQLDPVVAQALDKHTLQQAHKAHHDPTTSDSDPGSDTDSLLDSLSEDPVFAAHRAARLQALSQQLSQQKTLRASGHGTVTTCTSEKELMDIVISTPQTLCHFFHPGFARCAVMDRLLEGLVGVHVEVRFLRVGVEAAGWLCGKLGVRVLPCLVGWTDGVEVGRCVGFEGVKGGENGGVGCLERALVEKGMLVRVKIGAGSTMDLTKNKEQEEEDVGDDDDWD